MLKGMLTLYQDSKLTMQHYSLPAGTGRPVACPPPRERDSPPPLFPDPCDPCEPCEPCGGPEGRDGAADGGGPDGAGALCSGPGRMRYPAGGPPASRSGAWPGLAR